MNIEKITTPENTAFIEQLYQEYKYLMYASMKKYINELEVIEDILHDCMIRLIPKASVLLHMEKPAVITYLMYTDRNTTFNYLKHKALESNYLTFDMREVCEELQTETMDGRSVESQIIQDNEANQFRKMLMELPERDQEILIRKYYLDETNPEIAKYMGCKPDSVRMLLTRARRSMLNVLRKEKSKDEDAETVAR